jgi:RNA polymerase sigma-70 factor (ECF subfamily)
VEENERLGDFISKSPMPFHLWLRRIALDRLIDAHRRHRVAARRSVDREAGRAAGGAGRSSIDLLASIVDSGLTPAAAAIREELARRFREALDHLVDDDREIVLMRHFEHLTNREAALALGLSDAAAGMRLLRALRRLRVVLGESSGPGDDPASGEN